MQLDATPIHDPPIHNPNPLRLGEHYESDEDDDDDVPEHHSKADNSQKEHAGPSPSSALASLLEIDVSPFGPDIDPIFRDFYEKKLAPPPDSKAYDKLKTLKESYPPPGNMPYLRAPELNKIFQTKIKSYSVKAVEKHLSDAQNLIGVAMNISLTSISKQFKDGKLENADDILKQSPQIDSLRALAWTQRSISNARRRVLKVILSSQGQEALSGETSLLETQLFPTTELEEKLKLQKTTAAVLKSQPPPVRSRPYPQPSTSSTRTYKSYGQRQGKLLYPSKMNFHSQNYNLYSCPKPLETAGPLQLLQGETATSAQVEKERINKVSFSYILPTSDFKAGNTANFVHNWQKITANKTVLSWIQGIQLEFLEPPPKSISREYQKFLYPEPEVISEVETLLKYGAIEEVTPESDQIVSSIFLVENSNKTKRVILNLKPINQYLLYHHFKMETLETIMLDMKKGDYFVSFDLKSAYLTIPVAKKFRKYLRFYYGNKLMQYNSMCFGLSPAPYYFTKIIKTILQNLRQSGIRIYGYLDDFLILGKSKEECLSALKKAICLFQNLGFIINETKSVLNPTRIITHLGFVLDSNSMTI